MTMPPLVIDNLGTRGGIVVINSTDTEINVTFVFDILKIYYHKQPATGEKMRYLARVY